MMSVYSYTITDRASFMRKFAVSEMELGVKGNGAGVRGDVPRSVWWLGGPYAS